MTLAEAAVVTTAVAAGLMAAHYFNASYHWTLGIVALLLGFLSTLTAFGLVGELAVRQGYSRMGTTNTPVVRRALLIGAGTGVIFGGLFYFAATEHLFPSAPEQAHLLAASLFSLIVALAVAFPVMLHGTKHNIIPRRAV